MIAVTTYEQLALLVTENLANDISARYTVNPTTSEHLQHLLFNNKVFWANSIGSNVVKFRGKSFLYVKDSSLTFGSYDEPLHAKDYLFIDTTSI